MQGQIDEALYQRCQEVQADFVSLWRQLVDIDSGTGYGEGLTQVGNIAVEFLKTVGAEIQRIPVQNGKAGFHIIATLTGKGTGKVLAMAHMDTVFSTGTAADRPFRIADEWAYGPGVSDCKGSVALCLFALQLLHERNYQEFAKITCLFNCDEETGSPSSRDLIQTLAKEHDVVLCCEPGQVGDGVVLWRKGSALMTVEVQGRSSHAGSAPQDGRNAIMELINQVGQLSQLEKADKLTSVNFTTIQAGDRTNVIPDYAVAQADIRVVYTSELERIEQQSALIASQTAISDTTVTVHVSRQNPPFPQNEGTTALISHAQSIYGELGLSLKEAGAGGASDANWAAVAGAVVIDGLGPVKGGINHTDKERTNIHSVVPRLYLLTRLFMDAGKE
jgi:glutamate carboxypeptidase